MDEVNRIWGFTPDESRERDHGVYARNPVDQPWVDTILAICTEDAPRGGWLRLRRLRIGVFWDRH